MYKEKWQASRQVTNSRRIFVKAGFSPPNKS